MLSLQIWVRIACQKPDVFQKPDEGTSNRLGRLEVQIREIAMFESTRFKLRPTNRKPLRREHLRLNKTANATQTVNNSPGTSAES